MKYTIYVTEKQAEMIKQKLEEKATIIGESYGLLKLQLTIEHNVDLLALFFAGIDYGMKSK